jgi:hypothetical protein
MMASTQGGSQTGTRDETYDVVAVLYHALQGAENCQTYSQDAGGDQELRSFFDEALNQQRQIADRAKQLLKSRLERDTGQSGGSAFGFGQGGSSSQAQGASTGPSAEGTARS